MTQHAFLATCARGCEPFVAAELAALHLEVTEEVSGGVLCRGDFAAGMRACLYLRCATKLLLSLGTAQVRQEGDLYDSVRALDLAPWFSPRHSLAVDTHLNDPRFGNAHFLSLKIKDAVVDDVRDRCGERPSVDTKKPDVAVVAHVVQGTARYYLAMQGESLHNRGYRRRHVEAPLKESLAASLLAFSQWDGATPLLDPMCGSGTLVIEAALLATGTAPGIQRHFGFERWPIFSDAVATTWAELRAQAKAARRATAVPFFASDHDGRAVAAAENNARTAGVADLIHFSVRDVATVDPCPGGGQVVVNPPYGERIGSGLAAEVHDKLARHVRHFEAHRLAILSTPVLLRQQMHMRPERRLRVFNGPLACEMASYQTGGQGG